VSKGQGKLKELVEKIKNLISPPVPTPVPVPIRK
jgi:hypothetical protein